MKLTDSNLDEKTRRAIEENGRLESELLYLSRSAERLVSKNNALLSESRQLKVKLEAADEMAATLAKRTSGYQANIRTLVAKVHAMESERAHGRGGRGSEAMIAAEAHLSALLHHPDGHPSHGHGGRDSPDVFTRKARRSPRGPHSDAESSGVWRGGAGAESLNAGNTDAKRLVDAVDAASLGAVRLVDAVEADARLIQSTDADAKLRDTLAELARVNAALRAVESKYAGVLALQDEATKFILACLSEMPPSVPLAEAAGAAAPRQPRVSHEDGGGRANRVAFDDSPPMNLHGLDPNQRSAVLEYMLSQLQAYQSQLKEMELQHAWRAHQERGKAATSTTAAAAARAGAQAGAPALSLPPIGVPPPPQVDHTVPPPPEALVMDVPSLNRKPRVKYHSPAAGINQAHLGLAPGASPRPPHTDRSGEARTGGGFALKASGGPRTAKVNGRYTGVLQPAMQPRMV